MLRLRTGPCVLNMLALAAFASPSATDLLTPNSALAVDSNHVSPRQISLTKSSLAGIQSDTRRTHTDGARRPPLEIGMVDSKSSSRRILNRFQGEGRMLSVQKPKPRPKPPTAPDPHGFLGLPAPSEHCHHYCP